jgi:hypothetical protein
LADLQGVSFAQLVTALQTRFDHAELAMFVVDGEQVGVRVGGVVQPLLASRQPLATAAELPRPSAGVRVVEATLTQRPAAAAPAAAPAAANRAAPPAAAPPPSRGLSIRGRPSGEAAVESAPPSGAAPSGPAPGAAAPAAPGGVPSAPASDKPESSGDDASARFSLLELD